MGWCGRSGTWAAEWAVRRIASGRWGGWVVLGFVWGALDELGFVVVGMDLGLLQVGLGGKEACKTSAGFGLAA